MSRALLLHVRFAEGRYHGTGDWPPAPARLFQALVSAAAKGGQLDGTARTALAWLEGLEPPDIAAPAAKLGQEIRNYVPNNDLDAVDGDLRRVGEIRASKISRPRLFDVHLPLTYAWVFDGSAEAMTHAGAMIDLAGQLYQLGRGIDFAWSTAEIVSPEEAERRLASRNSPIWRPSDGRSRDILACPVPGSLASLEARFRATRRRFSGAGGGRLTFAQPPKASFRSVAYNTPNEYLVFELRRGNDRTIAPEFAPWPLAAASALAERVRDLVASRLAAALPEQAETIARCLVGRGADDADKRRRVRFLPLPSIGHALVDQGIRRLAVEIPAECPVAAADIEWAASGIDLDADPKTGEIVPRHGAILSRAEDRRILARYGIGSSARAWQSVTPLVLPQSAARRRLDPLRLREPGHAKDAVERSVEEAKAAAAIAHAMRHAGIATPMSAIQLQREPHGGRGKRAELFAAGTRFAKERLWHVRIEFAEPVEGPLSLGDGRYLGLGLLHPAAVTPRDIAVLKLPVGADIPGAQGSQLVLAARRALMSLARQPDGSVPLLFSGHEPQGDAARSGQHRHVFIAAIDSDNGSRVDSLLIVAPWVCDRTVRRDQRAGELFETVVANLRELRAGRLGKLNLTPVDPDQRLIGPAREWESRSDYRPTRHAGRGEEPAEALLVDVVTECRRRGIPAPKVELRTIMPGPRGGISARMRLRFAVALSGPLLLGRDSHAGGGLFVHADMPRD
jgi:CRISPR-associated protein Csb2